MIITNNGRKNFGRWGEKGRHGVRFTGIFLNNRWKNKEVCEEI